MKQSTLVINNLIWKLLERTGAQGVTFIVSIVLARLLEPSAYGTIALVMVFITIMQVFVDSGLGNALIQKKDADIIDFSTVFFFNIMLCTVLYIIMFFCAPLISRFYGIAELTPIIQVLSIIIIISGVKNIQQAYVAKNMLFKKFFFATIGGTIGAAIIGIYFAYQGYGVWALVAQNLFNVSIDTIILWITVNWRPKRVFSFSRLKSLYRYGWKLLVSSLLDVGYNDMRSLVIGKLYSANDLAFYNRGQQLPNLIVSNINTSIDSVLLPTLSSKQDDKARVKNMTRRAIKTSSFLMMPMMVGLAVCAEPLIRLLLTEKWLPTVFYLRIFCFTFAFYPIHTANLNAIKAVGRSDLYLKLEIIKKVIGLIALLSTMFISVEAMAYSLLFVSVSSQIVNSWPNKTLLNYSYIEQLKDMAPQVLLASLMGVVVYLINFIPVDDLVKLIIQSTTGIIVYVVGAKLFKVDSFDYLINIAKEYFKRNSK